MRQLAREVINEAEGEHLYTIYQTVLVLGTMAKEFTLPDFPEDVIAQTLFIMALLKKTGISVETATRMLREGLTDELTALAEAEAIIREVE